MIKNMFFFAKTCRVSKFRLSFGVYAKEMYICHIAKPCRVSPKATLRRHVAFRHFVCQKTICQKTNQKTCRFSPFRLSFGRCTFLLRIHTFPVSMEASLFADTRVFSRICVYFCKYTFFWAYACFFWHRDICFRIYTCLLIQTSVLTLIFSYKRLFWLLFQRLIPHIYIFLRICARPYESCKNIQGQPRRSICPLGAGTSLVQIISAGPFGWNERLSHVD